MKQPAIEAFDRFWNLYPRRIGKGAARRAWASAIRRADPEAIIAAISAHLAAGLYRDTLYTPYPATWLHQERWADEIAGPNARPQIPTGTDGVNVEALARSWRAACRSGDEVAKRTVILDARAHGLNAGIVFEVARRQREQEEA